MKQIPQKKRRVTITETTYEQTTKGRFASVSNTTKFETDITGKWLKGKTPLDLCKGNCDRIITVKEAEAAERAKKKEAIKPKKTVNRFTSSSTGAATEYVTSNTQCYPAKQMVKWRLKVDEFHIGEITVPMSVDKHDAMQMILEKANSIPDIEPNIIQMMPELIYHKSLAEQYK